MKLLIMSALLINGLLSFSAFDPMDDITIFSKVGNCNNPLQNKQVKNNSRSRSINVAIKKIIFVEGIRRDSAMLDFHLLPSEEKSIGCAGCEFKDSRNICTYFSVHAASYINP